MKNIRNTVGIVTAIFGGILTIGLLFLIFFLTFLWLISNVQREIEMQFIRDNATPQIVEPDAIQGQEARRD